MKKVAGFLCVFVLVLGTSATALATVLDFSDYQVGWWKFNANDQTEKTWNFDLLNDRCVDLDGDDCILWAKVKIYATRSYNDAKADLYLFDTRVADDVPIGEDPEVIDDVKPYLTQDYKLALGIKDVSPIDTSWPYLDDGTFTVFKVEVFGQYNECPASVPDASIMFLLGPGLVGLGLFGRRRFFKK
jgi:hypothetical protein